MDESMIRGQGDAFDVGQALLGCERHRIAEAMQLPPFGEALEAAELVVLAMLEQEIVEALVVEPGGQRLGLGRDPAAHGATHCGCGAVDLHHH